MGLFEAVVFINQIVSINPFSRGEILTVVWLKKLARKKKDMTTPKLNLMPPTYSCQFFISFTGES
jgi:hypothetical protein